MLMVTLMGVGHEVAVLLAGAAKHTRPMQNRNNRQELIIRSVVPNKQQL
jgi:hypothetical protein